MNVSYRWLRALAPSITDSPDELAHRLSLLGAPVDEVVMLGAEISDVVIAQVTDVRPHPNADRLRVCTVDAGGGAPLQVVCGAANVEANGWYPFAPVGASLPGGVQIRKAKLRGEISEGMLCSARELGLGRDHAGLMTLNPDGLHPGEPMVRSLGLDDVRMVLDITPNRSELLSHIGVARELAPRGIADIVLPQFPAATEPMLTFRDSVDSGSAGGVRVRIDDPTGCSRYTAAVVRGVRVGPSPEWLSTRLRAVGLRPINNVVDATNYVLYELGQPLHAFDLDRIHGGAIAVRRAASGETLRTLDGEERRMENADLVIADGEGPIAVAGVMGGENSEVRTGTANLLIECARFDARSVRRTRTRLGMSTDASYRFERGVDPEGQPSALERVVQLIVAVTGGIPDRGAVDVNPVPFARPKVELRSARVRQVLGAAIGAEEIAQLLGPIGFELETTDSGVRVDVPGFRPDVVEEVDLIEEIARRRGYDSFAEELRSFRPSSVPEDPTVRLHRRVRELLRSRGFLEARTVGFASAEASRVPLLTPLSAEESHLRDSLVPGLLRRVEHNLARGVRDVRLFEIGTVFHPDSHGGAPREEFRVAAVFTGARRPPHWTGAAPVYDLWDVRGLLEELAESIPGLTVGANADSSGFPPMLNAQEAFAVSRDGHSVGFGGRTASAALDAPAWAEPVFVLELSLPHSPSAPHRQYAPIPAVPANDRDLALLVPHDVAALTVEQVIRRHGGEMLASVRPFDLYDGKGIPEGVRSIAFRLRFRAADRTLTDTEVDASVSRILGALDTELGVRLR